MSTIYENMEESIDKIKSNIITVNEQTLKTYDFNNMTGEVLDNFGLLFGINRLTNFSNGVQLKYISIDFKDEVQDYIIPIGTKFFISDTIYCETLDNIKFSGTIAIIDVIFPVKLATNTIIPIMQIINVDSLNTGLKNLMISTTSILSLDSNTETDLEYKQRLYQYASGKNIDSEGKIQFILQSSGITDYAFIKNDEKLMPGVCLVVINPPEYSEFLTYRNTILEKLKDFMDVVRYSVHIIKPTLRELTIYNYNAFPDSLYKRINALNLGQIVSVEELKKICGENITVILDNEIVTNISIKYYEKIKLIIDKISEESI